MSVPSRSRGRRILATLVMLAVAVMAAFVGGELALASHTPVRDLLGGGLAVVGAVVVVWSARPGRR